MVPRRESDAGVWTRAVRSATPFSARGDNHYLDIHVRAWDKEAPESEYREVRISDCCWIGARVPVLVGVSIGADAVAAAGSVVTKDCEPGALYASVAARMLR